MSAFFEEGLCVVRKGLRSALLLCSAALLPTQLLLCDCQPLSGVSLSVCLVFLCSVTEVSAMWRLVGRNLPTYSTRPCILYTIYDIAASHVCVCFCVCVSCKLSRRGMMDRLYDETVRRVVFISGIVSSYLDAFTKGIYAF